VVGVVVGVGVVVEDEVVVVVGVVE